MAYQFISEHDSKNDSGQLVRNYSDDLMFADMLIIYPCNYTDDLKMHIQEFAKNFDFDGSIVVFEECVEKGGGGGLPSLIDFIYMGLSFVVTKGAAAFLEEMVKDVYKNKIKSIFKSNKDVKPGKFKKGKAVLSLITDNGKVLSYYFPSFLDQEEAYVALCQCKNHFLDMNVNSINQDDEDFLYDRGTYSWLNF